MFFHLLLSCRTICDYQGGNITHNQATFFIIMKALMEIHCHGHPQKGPVHFLIPWTLQAYYPGSKGRAAATDNPPNPSHFETSKCQQELLLAFTERKKIN